MRLFEKGWLPVTLEERERGGARERVGQLYEESRNDVYRYLLTLGLTPAVAQDTAQEAFLRLYAALREGEAIRNDRAWLFRVAHNLGLKARSREGKLTTLDSDSGERLAANLAGPEVTLLKRERMLRFHKTVESLSEQQRRCLFLRMEGLKYPEIGAALGISPSAVGEFLRRAMARLRKDVP